ncbi:hypothetical protein GGX14DRAFT_402580 [Mycena pura]|uniref:Uncharacterized protein n=1 Tax=Mycena pura TaxID=153505 RepID=A0AAD6UXT1_9AGAR|nr:hypothetical protein GGX14DRAFT_402580 [Mycena pura]
MWNTCSGGVPVWGRRPPQEAGARSGGWNHGRRNGAETDLDGWAVPSHDAGNGEVREAKRRTTQAAWRRVVAFQISNFMAEPPVSNPFRLDGSKTCLKPASYSMWTNFKLNYAK